MLEQVGITDGGHRYRARIPQDGVGPILLELKPSPRKKWMPSAGTEFIGRTFVIRLDGQPVTLFVVAATLSPLTGRMELTCR